VVESLQTHFHQLLGGATPRSIVDKPQFGEPTSFLVTTTKKSVETNLMKSCSFPAF